MSRSYPMRALLLGLIAFGVLELGGYLIRGYYLSSPPETLLSALAFSLATLLSALLLRALLRWAEGLKVLVALIPFALLLTLLAGVLDGALFLTYLGRWGMSDEVTMMLLYDPINLMIGWADIWSVSVPVLLIMSWLLGRAARASRQRRRSLRF